MRINWLLQSVVRKSNYFNWAAGQHWHPFIRKTHSNSSPCFLSDVIGPGIEPFVYRFTNDESDLLNGFICTVYIFYRNAVRTDEGVYVGRLRHSDLWSQEFKIRLIYNHLEDVRLVSMQLFVALGALSFFLLIGVLTWCNKTKILLFKRRHFGTFDKGDWLKKLWPNLEVCKVGFFHFYFAPVFQKLTPAPGVWLLIKQNLSITG